MKTKFTAFLLSILLAMPCVLRAEEVEILLSEVIGMSVLPGDNPLDDPDSESGCTHPSAEFPSHN